MGYRWTVTIWVFRDFPLESGYREEQYYGSQSWLKAAWNFIKAKREGYGCVKLEWR
jgi:hypothetical protein